MSSLDFLNGPTLFIETGATTWQIFDGDDFAEIPARSTEALRAFVTKKGWRPRLRALVALEARGVSLRRLSVPQVSADQLRGLLRLQIENEFPLGPDELAWGAQVLKQNDGKADVLVAAVKKETVEATAKILQECGITPVFTLAALARHAVCPPPTPSGFVLHVGANQSELVAYKEGAPVSVRLVTLPLNPKLVEEPLYLTGRTISDASVAGRRVLDGNVAKDRPLAIVGLRKFAAGVPMLALETGETKAAAAKAIPWPWLGLAALLLLAWGCFPYAEAIALKPRLEHKLAVIQPERARLPAIDHELDFLQFIKHGEPPYLDTVYLLSKIAPSGTSFESVSMSRRGDLALRGKLNTADDVTTLRSNMIQSAWFSAVVVEEQTPTPDRHVSVRMTAQLKPAEARKPLPEEPSAKAGKSTNAPALGKKPDGK